MESPVLSGSNSKRASRGFWPAWPLLLGCLSVGLCLGEDCVLGIVGQSVLLPCLHPGLSAFKNVSIEWRREDEVVLVAAWEDDGNVDEWSLNRATVASDALLTGNLSLELPTVDPTDNRVDYSLLMGTGASRRAVLCSVCLRSAAGFTSPLLLRDAAQGGGTTYTCRSSGGFPRPAVRWVIDGAEAPPEGSVRTEAASDPDSRLYDVTSRLTLGNDSVSSVSCVVENRVMNESLTSTSYDVQSSAAAAAKDPSGVLWVFSLALCVAVGAMVVAAVVYQIHLDRTSKKRRMEYESSVRGHKRQFPNEVETELLKIETDA